MTVVLLSPLLAVLIIWAAFWVIRLAVRHGVNDALQMNRQRPGAGSEGGVPLR